MEKPTADDSFDAHATLDQDGFYKALMVAGFPDLSSSNLADFLFRNLGKKGKMTREKFRSVVEIASSSRAHFMVGAGGISMDLAAFREFCGHALSHETTSPHMSRILCAVGTDRLSKFLPEQYVQFANEESFSRYDTKRNGVLDEGDLLALNLSLDILAEVFFELVEGTNVGLTRETFPLAMVRVGMPDPSKTFQGQLFDAVFSRADLDGNGIVTFAEFMRCAMRLVYPVLQFESMKECLGYPGWTQLRNSSPSPEDLAVIIQRISELRTGDLVLMQDTSSPMGRFVNFSLDSPWSHVGVVVERTPLTGIANVKSEELLQKFPFRRNAHRFCSPGYCRCFDSSQGDFAPSRIEGLSKIGLLESTGEGIHLYDLAHRLFEPGGGRRWSSIAIVPLHGAPNRQDTVKINAFVQNVRGQIYTVAKDELKAAISFHDNSHASGLLSPVLPNAAHRDDTFCASLVMLFYRHMGWVGHSRPVNSVMPCDFHVQAKTTTPQHEPINTNKISPVILKDAWLSPPELVLCPDLNANLPLKLPKRKT